MTPTIKEKQDRNLWRLSYVTPDASRILTGFILAQTWFAARQLAEPTLRKHYKATWDALHQDHEGKPLSFMISDVKAVLIEEAQIVGPEEALNGEAAAVTEARARSGGKAFRWIPSTREWEPVALKGGRKKR